MKRFIDQKSQVSSFRHQVSKAFSVLSIKDKRHVTKLIAAQSTLSIIDLVSILLIGVFVSSNLSDAKENKFIEKITLFLSKTAGSDTQAMRVLLVVAVVLLLFKTFLSIFLTRKTLKFFSSNAAELSAKLINFIFSKGIENIQKRPLQELIFSTTRGVEILSLQIMATIAIMISDLSLLLILAAGLFLIDTSMAIISITLFSGVALLLNSILGGRSTKLGERNSLKSIASNQAIEKLYYSFRELFVKNRVNVETNQISLARKDLSETLAKINFFPYIGKYVIEASLVIGGTLVAVVVFSTKDLSSALSVMAMFLASASRIAPSILRLQQSYITVRSYFGMTEPTLNLLTEMKLPKESINQDIIVSLSKTDSEESFVGDIVIKDLVFEYSQEIGFSVIVHSLQIKSGATVAIVGPSGAGKSTLIDLILGLLSPNCGSITISGHEPAAAIAKWPGRIAYVPQQMRIFDGSIAENITQGFSAGEILDSDLMDAVNASALTELISTPQEAFALKLGAKGINLSGGQTQRVGIARALLTKPNVIIFDEATSALDADTESTITETLAQLRGKTTVIIVAHRLSTVLNADSVVYLRDGQIVAEGSFGEVRSKVPDFDRQAQLMGLANESSN